jgi:tyrosyl-tRNA synthetase
MTGTAPSAWDHTRERRRPSRAITSAGALTILGRAVSPAVSVGTGRRACAPSGLLTLPSPVPARYFRPSVLRREPGLAGSPPAAGIRSPRQPRCGAAARYRSPGARHPVRRTARAAGRSRQLTGQAPQPLSAEQEARIAELARDLAVGAAQVIPEDGLAGKLRAAERESRPLRIKLGIDPSGSDLTLGHAVVLRKLRQFQDAGHVAVLIVGDFTGQVGDPTGKTKTRSVLTREQTTSNAETYMAQALKILREDRLELRYNSEWLAGKSLSDVLDTTRALTVAQLLERDDFARRYRESLPITLMEFMYPMLQGMDSVAIDADFELGGTDQTFNNLVGRVLQRAAGADPQVVLTVPLLRGTDGVEKMGKSLGNFVALNDSADDKFGKAMSIPDDLMPEWAELCCGWTAAELDEFRATMDSRPMDAKRAIARRIVELYDGAVEAKAAEERFTARFSRRELPVEDLPEFTLRAGADPASIIDILLAAGLASSKGEARRVLEQGGIKLDGDKLTADSLSFTTEYLDGKVLQRGKRHAVRLAAKE